MHYVLVTDSALPAAIVSEAALQGESLRIVCADRRLAAALRRRGHVVVTGKLDAEWTWRRMNLTEDTLVVVALATEDASLEVVRRVTELVPDAPVVVLDAQHDAPETSGEDELSAFRNVERVRLADAVRAPFQQKFANAMVRRRMHQYRDHFNDAEKVLILLHDDPDPDALASALALRALLGRNRQTAIIATFKAPTRPENLRMIELLEVDVREITVADLPAFGRIAVVDTQPHIFGGAVPEVDLVIDHHPVRTGYSAVFKDIRTSFGATTSLVLDYLIRCGIPVSERLATAAVHAIKTDTWSFRRGAVPEDVNIFAYVYPRADQALLRRIEMEGFTLDTLRFIAAIVDSCELVGRFLHVHVGDVPRDDLVPTTADFMLNLAEANWTAVSGVLEDKVTISVRNLGYQKSAGELVQQVYGALGSAGGHRSAAKAILPLDVVRKRFGDPDRKGFSRKLFEPLWQAAGEKPR